MTKEKKYFLTGILVGIVPGMLGFYGFIRLMHSLGGRSPFLEKYMSTIRTLMFALAILGAVFFVSGLMKYFFDLKKHNEKTIAKWLLFYGLLLIILMIGLWAAIGYFQASLGLQSASGPGGI